MMRIIVRVLILLGLEVVPCWLVDDCAYAQTRGQHERRLTDLEQRFEQLLELEEWQHDRHSQLEQLVREMRDELKAVSSQNKALRDHIATQEVAFNQLRLEQSALQRNIPKSELTSNLSPRTPSTRQTPGNVAPLKIVPPTATPPPVVRFAGFSRVHRPRPGVRPLNSYSWPSGQSK